MYLRDRIVNISESKQINKSPRVVRSKSSNLSQKLFQLFVESRSKETSRHLSFRSSAFRVRWMKKKRKKNETNFSKISIYARVAFAERSFSFIYLFPFLLSLLPISFFTVFLRHYLPTQRRMSLSFVVTAALCGHCLTWTAISPSHFSLCPDYRCHCYPATFTTANHRYRVAKWPRVASPRID